MNIILVNQFYPPDVAPTGQVLHDLAVRLVARGHTVSVLCSRAAYSGDATYPGQEDLDGVRVVRVSAAGFGSKSHLRKLLSYATFVCSVGVELVCRRERPDVVVCLTTPPYIGLLGRCLAGLRGHLHAHWIMDVYPDVMAAHGMLEARRRSGSPLKRLVFRFLQCLTKLELGGSALTVTLGPDMAEHVGCYVRRDGNSADGPVLPWVPLWGSSAIAGNAGQRDVLRLRQERGWRPDEVVFLYSGNMGLGHRLTEFLEAARRLAAEGGGVGGTTDRNARFAFSGSGKRRSLVEEFVGLHPEAGVQLLPYVPREQLRAHLMSANVLLASLEPAWAGCMLPSKLQSIFAVGKPVLFVGPRECSMADWIREADAGWTVDAGDVGGLLEAVARAKSPELRDRCAANAARFSAAHFDMGTNCDRICALLETAVAARKQS